jgi:hypothetical protein
MRHRLYNLHGPQTFLGIELSDILLGAVAWMFGNFINNKLFPARLSMLITILSVAAVVFTWRALKDKLPPGFFRHFSSWASEANTYIVGIDRTARPAVVDHQRVLGHLKEEKAEKKRRSKQAANVNPHIRPKLKHPVLPLGRDPQD